MTEGAVHGSTSSPRTVVANYERIFKPALSLSMGEGEMVDDVMVDDVMVDDVMVVRYNAASEERCPPFML